VVLLNIDAGMMYFCVTSDMSATSPAKKCNLSASGGHFIVITSGIYSFWIIVVSEINNR
jgi:hypothetical protein